MKTLLKAITVATLLQASIAPAAPRETPIPAGRTGLLEVEIDHRGTVGGRVIDRSMRMALRLVSAETSPVNMLGTEADEDTQAQVAHQQAVGAAMQGGADLMVAAGKALEEMVAACSADETSAVCAAAKQRYQAANAEIERMQSAVQAVEQRGPALTSQHRYQQWSTSFERGCGTIEAWVRDRGPNTATGNVRLPKGDSPEQRLATCGTTLVLDRRAQRMYLAIQPFNLAMPRLIRADDHLLIDRGDLDSDAGADVDHWAGTLFLRGQPLQGDERQAKGSATYRSARGMVTTVNWRFRQDG